MLVLLPVLGLVVTDPPPGEVVVGFDGLDVVTTAVPGRH